MSELYLNQARIAAQWLAEIERLERERDSLDSGSLFAIDYARLKIDKKIDRIAEMLNRLNSVGVRRP